MSTGTVILESSLSRILSHVENKSFGMISACRAERSHNQNKELTANLKNKIRAAGFGYININGSYVENSGTDNETVVKEKSFIVIGNTEEETKRLFSFLMAAGEQYNQECIFFKPFNDTQGYLYFTNGTNDKLAVGDFHPMRIGDYYTEMQGKKFSFIQLNEEKSWLEKWAEVLTEKNEK